MGDKILYLDISEYTHDGMDGTCCGAAESLEAAATARGSPAVHLSLNPSLPMVVAPSQTPLDWCQAQEGDHTRYLLADEKHIYSAEVEVVKERERGQSIIGRMLSGIKLSKEQPC
jgi:hypothetical protein